MTVNPPAPEDARAGLAAGPTLAGIPVVVLGPTRSELLTARLLRDHGADVHFAASAWTGPGLATRAGLGIVVDAERDTGHGTLDASAAAESVAAGGIYCLFTGLPPTAPAAVPPSNETLIAAELGLNRVGDPAGQPDPEPLGVASGYAAIWAAIYLTAALRVRLTTGRGTRLEVPLFSAGLSVIGRNLVSLDRSELIDPLTRPKLPISEIYECRDGRFVQSHGTFPHFADILCRVIGRPEWAADAAAGVTELASLAEVQLWRERFAAAFRQRDALDWEQALNEAGGACTMCRTHEEWRREHEVAEAGIVSVIPDPPGPGPTGPAVTISAEACPDDGALTGGLDAGRGTGWPGRLGADGPTLPLSGLRVLDFCIILAGPTCGRTLAELGADVIKIDSPGRPVSPYGWLDVNRGKRSMLIDLKDPGGAALARELTASADVVLENFRAGKMTDLGLGYATLRELRPGLIYGSMNAFDFGSDWAARAGWEHNAQAGSGMQEARQRDGRPQAVPVPVNDYATGLLAAFGVLLAVVRRDRTGAPAQVRASLARTATFLQLGAAPGEEQLGRRPDASCSIRTADGWIRAEPDEPTAGANPTEDFVNTAEVARFHHPEALDMIRARGVLAVTERIPQDLLNEAWAREEGLIVKWEHPQWGPLRQGMARMRASEFRPSAGWPAPDPGEHTADILTQLGRSQEEIDSLHAQGAVAGPSPLFSVAE